MNVTLKESMQFKLNEAKFFFEHMRELEQTDDKLHFRYYFSAFVSSLRSVLQYAYEYDSIKYGKLVVNLKFKKYFTEIRNVNIHQKPLTVSKIHQIDLCSTVVVKMKSIAFSLDEEQLKKIPIEELIESYEFQESSEEPEQKEYIIGEDQLDYFFFDISLIDICKEHIEEVEEFVKDFSK